jgi:hypothetical protein
MSRLRTGCGARLLLLGALCAGSAGGLTAGVDSAAESTDVRTLLRDVARFTDADWAAVERGAAVAKILDTDTREIAVAGAVRIAAPSERLVARLREVENLQRSSIVLAVGRFSRPAQADDLLNAPFEDYNLDLRDCRPGDCRVRMAGADIARFHRQVDWRAGDARARSAGVWREVLAGYAAEYDRRGRQALPVYENKPEPLSVASELSLLVEDFGFVARYSPELYDYLREFGPARPAGAEDTIYWSKEDFGVRPVFRISHQVIHRRRGTAGADIAATNQIYADHYMDAALGVTLAIPAPGGATDGFYMVAVNRARTRSLSGVLRRLIRGTVQGRSRDAMRKILTATKSALEAR